MKIDLEKAFLLAFIIVLSSYAIYYVSSISDLYVHYLRSAEIVKDPSFLFRDNLTGWQSFLANQIPIYINYPPLQYFMYAVFMITGMPMYLITILAVLIIGFILYKIDKRALPFMFLSFMFIREVAFNSYDILLVGMTVLSFYMLEKKKFIPSGILASLTTLIKPIGFFILLSWLISLIVFERKNLNKYVVAAIILALLLPIPWYLRNYTVTNDVYLSLIGVTKEGFVAASKAASTAFQLSQPERKIWDSTGYYPLPIDLLFYAGLAFFAYNLIRTKKFNMYSVPIIVMAAAYFYFQLSGGLLFVIRQEMLIFPFLALEIARGLPPKLLKYAYVVALASLIAFSFYVPKYAFNSYDDFLSPNIAKVKDVIDGQPVYVKAFQDMFIIYRYNLNASAEADSNWTLDVEQGQLYPTNKTNITG